VTKEKNGEWGGEDVDLARKLKGLTLLSEDIHILNGSANNSKWYPLLFRLENWSVCRLSEIAYSSEKLKVESYRLILLMIMYQR